MTDFIFVDAIANPGLVANFDPLADKLIFSGISASGVHVTRAATSVTFSTPEGSLTLPVTIDELVNGSNIAFADGSILAVGDNTTNILNDALGNSLSGGNLGDQLHGRTGADTINGGPGDNLIYGNKGNDQMLAGAGADSLYGGQGADVINDAGGDNLVYGNLGNDQISSAGGADTVYGGQGDDLISTGDGADWIFGNRGDDTLTGGAGADHFVYRRMEDGSDVITDFTIGEDKITLAYKILQIANVDATNFVNNVSGTAATSLDTRLIYDQSTNTLYFDPDGSGSYNTPQALITFISGADGLSASDFEVFGTAQALTGTNGADTLSGQSGNDTLIGTGGNDWIHGGVGTDTLRGGAGNDTLIGGNQADTALYDGHGSAINVDLLAGTVVDGIGDTDILESIERVVGTSFGDTMAADPRILFTTFNAKYDYLGGLQLYGDGGDDVMSGGFGWLLDGGAGNDTITSTGGVNLLRGGAGHDVLNGGAGADSLLGGTGNDTLDGGGGANYIWGMDGDDVLSGGAGASTLWGGAGNDQITGGAGAETLFGERGNDILIGGDGGDVLYGGSGSDTLTGGAGNDLFALRPRVTQSSDADVITDFTAGDTVGLGGEMYRLADAVQLGSDVQVTMVSGYQLTFKNSLLADVNAALAYHVDNATRIGSEFQVNSQSAGIQRFASMSELNNGFVVTWSSDGQDGEGFGVYGQRYDAAGIPLGAEFQVNTNVANHQLWSSVSELSGGGFVVSWTSGGNQDSFGEGIFAQRYDAAGAKLGGEFQVNSHTAYNQYDPAMDGLTGGGFVVTWSSYNQDSAGGTGVYGQVYNAAGAKIGGEFRANTYVDGYQTTAEVTGLAGGGFVVTWDSVGQDGDGGGIYGQRFDANGGKLGGEFLVNTTTALNQGHPAVAALADGGFVVSWEGGPEGVTAQLFNAAGAKVGGELVVNTHTLGFQGDPAITTLNDGSFVITWTSNWQDGSANGVYGQAFTAAGAKLGSEFQVNTWTHGSQDDSKVIGLSDGRVVVAWTDDPAMSGYMPESDWMGKDVEIIQPDANGPDIHAQIFDPTWM